MEHFGDRVREVMNATLPSGVIEAFGEGDATASEELDAAAGEAALVTTSSSLEAGAENSAADDRTPLVEEEVTTPSEEPRGAEASRDAEHAKAAAPSAAFWRAPEDAGLPGPADFFLFIKDYSWSLRYRIASAAGDAAGDAGGALDLERPLELEWIKLRTPPRSPDELFQRPASEIFDWQVREPPRHQGFMYQVTEVVGSGVEAVINFFKGRGPNLLIQPSGIALAGEEDAEEVATEAATEADPGVEATAPAAAAAPPRPVTHCWVEVFGLPFFPVLQSIAFFDAQKVVIDWQA